MTTTPDGRPVPPPHADERTMLTAWLDYGHADLLRERIDGTIGA